MLRRAEHLVHHALEGLWRRGYYLLNVKRLEGGANVFLENVVQSECKHSQCTSCINFQVAALFHVKGISVRTPFQFRQQACAVLHYWLCGVLTLDVCQFIQHWSGYGTINAGTEFLASNGAQGAHVEEVHRLRCEKIKSSCTATPWEEEGQHSLSKSASAACGSNGGKQCLSSKIRPHARHVWVHRCRCHVGDRYCQLNSAWWQSVCLYEQDPSNVVKSQLHCVVSRR
mmetsp:Transcript_49443/g.115615  ORF Transcript_49443/g.115615 Transcript_49443/m.115615 type:complete len:228 (-) Transcript_49443:1136-1819(-)